MMPRTPEDPSHHALSHTRTASRPGSRGWLAAAVAMAVAGTSMPAAAASSASALPLMVRAPEDGAPGSVLGLDADKPKLGISLTNALRKAFANRGITGGEEISLEEMRLTMGCTDDGVVCLSDGGKTLGVQRMVFGYLNTTGKGQFQLTLMLLDTGSAKIEAEASIDLTRDQLSDANIDATAADIVRELMPKEQAEETPPSTDPLPVVEDDVEPAQPAEPKSGIYFGLEKPTPRWKWIGFGTSLGLTVVAGGATIGMGVWLTSKNGGFRGELIDAADASLTDDSDTNDVDPNLPAGVNLCDFARSRPTDADGNPLGSPGQVRNSSVVAVCNKGDDIRKAQVAAGIGTAVFGVSTLAFTALLLVHKRKPGTEALLRHDVRLGLAPMRNGGLSLGGGMRF